MPRRYYTNTTTSCTHLGESFSQQLQLFGIRDGDEHVTFVLQTNVYGGQAHGGQSGVHQHDVILGDFAQLDQYVVRL